MKTFVEKLRGTFARKDVREVALNDHPNFWMYS